MIKTQTYDPKKVIFTFIKKEVKFMTKKHHKVLLQNTLCGQMKLLKQEIYKIKFIMNKELKKIFYKIIPVKTRIGLLNFFIIQWFFIRLLRNDKMQIIGILYFVLPLSGWWFSYIPVKFKTFFWRQNK